MRLDQLFWPSLAMAASGPAPYTQWSKDQVNVSICFWEQPRAALVRDTVYLDGGNVAWVPGLSDGSYGDPSSVGNLRGVIFSYNLTNPFDQETNLTKILIENTISKALGGSGNANGAAPNFVDGGMLANDNGFFMYGGAVFHNDLQYEDPDANYVIGREVYEGSPERAAWAPSFNSKPLSKGVNRYTAFGAAVSAPSENKAWYVPGMIADKGADIWTAAFDKKHLPTDMSDRMIEVDMSEQGQEVWTNTSLSKTSYKGRGNPEGVWVPVGEEGIIVMLGGVTHPQWASQSHKSDDAAASKKDSPPFMSTIDIYDVKSGKWYQQDTKDGPGQRTRGCAVVAPASDYSSFNIYYYGGFEGLDPTKQFYDDVWVLSLPSFTWTQLNKGSDGHARAGHKCFMPYPDQMLVFGGYRATPGTGVSCLEDERVVVNFNLTSGEWMDSYDPDKHDDYGVPTKVQKVIGGDALGSATLTTPSPSDWSTKALGEIFSSSYDTSKIKTYYPYKARQSETGRPEISNTSHKGGSGLPSWVAPVLGVVLGLMVVTAAIVIFCLWRRRKIFKNRSSDYGTEDNRYRILSWIKGQPTEKAATMTTSDETPVSPEMGEVKDVAAPVGSPTSPGFYPQEMAGTPIAELGDTSPPPPPAELSETALTPAEIVSNHSNVGSNPSRGLSHGSWRTLSSTDDFTASRASAGQSDDGDPRHDSPTVPTAAQGAQMQSISGTLASADRPEATRRESGQDTPVSPPTAGDSPGEDYVSARENMVSPMRKSVFHEEGMHEEKHEDKQ